MNIYDHYVTRRPVLAKSTLKQLFMAEDAYKFVLEMIRDDVFLERILVASDDLFEELQRVRTHQEMNKDTVHKVIKYLLRMSLRPMPFGLFAGIARKRFSQNKKGQANVYKKVRVSIDWLYLLAKQIETEQDCLSKLRIYKNSMLREAKDYMYLDLVEEREVNRVEFKNSVFIKELISYLQTPRTIRECIQYFSNNQPELQGTILKSLKVLLQHDFLYSSLRPGSIFVQEDGLNQLLKELGNDHPYYHPLLDIKESIQAYEKLEIGKGIEKFKLLKKKMKELCSSSVDLVVDLFLEDQAPELELSKIEDFVANIGFLSYLHTFSTNNKTWEEYSIKFLIEYGLFHEVPLLDLIDTDTGIGLPTINHAESKIEARLNRFMLNLIQDALLQQKDSIQLTQSHIEALKDILGTSEEVKIKDGFDVKFNLIQDGREEKFLLTDNSFAVTAGSFTGRFFDSSHLGNLPKFANEQYVSAEINAIPLHYGDIGITCYPIEHQININTSYLSKGNNFQLSDLYLGMDYGGLYLKSKALEKKILPVTTHLLQYINFDENPVLIFLSQFGKFISTSPKNFSFRGQSMLHVVPRIEYKNVILSPMRWNMNRTEMLRAMKEKKITEKQYVQDFINCYSVREVVHILKGDQTLPVMAHTALGLELITAELKRLGSGESLTLLEALEINSQSDQSFISDYIVTVLPKEMEVSSPATTNRSLIKSTDWTRSYDMEWSYFNIYYRKGKRLATKQICLELLERLGIEPYFVLAYHDPEEHIRLRFKTDHEHLKAECKDFLIKLVEEREIKRFTEDLFLPEYERYGGKELSRAAYDLFYRESKWLFQLLQSNFFKGKMQRDLGILICIHTIMDMFASYEQGRQFLDRILHEQGRKHVKAFKQHRDKYVSLGQKSVELYDAANQWLVEKRRAQREYVNKVMRNFAQEKAHYILQSMLHMTMNRFIGTNRKLESEIYEFSSYVYYNMKYQMEILGGYHEFV